MSIKHLLALFLLLTPAFAGSKTVVELFTSQACSSSAVADKILGELKNRDDLIVISWSVDLWDYLGWKDTLADVSHTKRQKNYANARGDGKVYTPQMVFSGGNHTSGLDPKETEQNIKITPLLSLEVTMTQNADSVTFAFPASSIAYYAMVVPVATEKKVTIMRGENRGKTQTYHHAARGMMPLLQANRDAKTVTLPKSQLPADADRLVVLLQTKDDKQNPKVILGAAELVLK